MTDQPMFPGLRDRLAAMDAWHFNAFLASIGRPDIRVVGAGDEVPVPPNQPDPEYVDDLPDTPPAPDVPQVDATPKDSPVPED